MANPFESLAQTSGPFENVQLPTEPEAPTPALARFRRAQVVAAANIDVSSDDIFQNFEQLTDQYIKNTELYGETQDDIAVAERRRNRAVNAAMNLAQDAPNFDPTGELQEGAVLATRQAIGADIERERQAALEKEAVDNIMDLAAGGNRTQAETMINALEHGSVVDQARDYAAKAMILQREIDRAGLEYSNEPWFAHVVNFAVSVIPFQKSSGAVGNVNVEGRNWLESIGDRVWSGERRNMEASALMNISDPEEFARILREQVIPNIHENSTLLGWTDKSEELNLLAGLKDRGRPVLNNAFNTLDNFGLVGAGEIAAGAKFATSLPRMLVGLGARREGAGALAAAAAKFTAGGAEEAVQRAGIASVNDVADELMPTIVRPDGGDMVVPVQAAANLGLENGLRIRDSLERLVQTGRFADDAEKEAAIQALKDSSAGAFGANRVVDIRRGETLLADDSSTNTIEFVLGKTAEEGYSNPAHAKAYADSLGFSNARVIQGEGGQHFVSVTRDLPETGWYSNALNVKTNNVLSRFLLGARQRSDEFLANRAQVSENTRNKIVNDHVRTLFKEINIDPVSKDRVAQLWQLGESKDKWFSLEEANIWYQRGFQRDISPKEWKAYNGLRDINDFEYAIRNDLRYKELVVKGYETVGFDAAGQHFDQLNGIVDDTFSRPIQGRAWNASTNGYSSRLTAEEIERLTNEGYVMVHLDDAQNLANGKQLTSVIVKRDQMVRDQLNRIQLPYRAGGHRIYKEKFFVKQARRMVDEDGNEVWQSPSTFMVGTAAEAKVWAETMEQARLIAVSDNPSLQAIDDVFKGRAGYPTAEQFMSNLETGKYSKEFSFTSMFDRELPREYDNLGSSFTQGDIDEEGITSYLRTNGRLYYSQKGDEALVDWQGAQAPVLNAYESVNRAFNNIANLSSYNDYKLTSIDRWVKTFGGAIDQSSVPSGASNMQKFLDAKPSMGATRDGVKQAMLDQRAIIMRNLGWKTEADAGFDEATRRFHSFVMGADPSSLRHEASRQALNWWTEKNPIQSLRGMAFDLKLGLFNPTQLFLQAGTFLAITAIDPAGAGRAVLSGPVLRHYLMRRSGEETLDAYVKAGLHTKMGFPDETEFRAFMGAAKNSGFFSINESHSLVNAMGPSTINLMGDPIKDVRQMGRFFFNEGETINRMAAFRVAWDRTIKKYSGVSNIVGKDQVLNEIFGEAEKFAFSMSRPSQAWWQQGLASIPTQFFAYQARMAEMMFGGQLTRAERARLIISQSLLYGTSGVPLAGVVSDLIKQKTGEAPDINTPAGFIDRGFMDWAINGATGADVLAGQRLGTGRFLGDTVGDLFGFSKYGETNTMDVVGGATYSITEDLAKSLMPFIKYSMDASGGDPGRALEQRHLKAIAMNISSLSNLTKFMLIRNYGEYTTNKGRVMANDVPAVNAWATLLLGAAPAESDQIGAIMAYQKDRKKVVTEATTVIEQYNVQVLNHPDRADDLGLELNAFLNMLDPEVKREAIEKARKPDESLLASLEERMERQQAERDVINQLEGSADSGQSY